VTVNIDSFTDYVFAQVTPDSKEQAYTKLQPENFIGKNPIEYALEFGTIDPIKQVISLDDILTHCSQDVLISVVGPTVGYFPDPLFARGVDVVGGRLVKNGDMLIRRLEQRKRWGDTTEKVCFRKKTYAGII
jgi:hypothetical protein